MTDEAAAQALASLTASGQRLAVAESLTGGLVAAALTDVPGASRVFRGGVTAYATEVKRNLLGVDGGLLETGGAVQAEVAREMATGVRELLGADWGLATTGVAGPEPQDGTPVGTVYVAVAGPDGQRPVAERLVFSGGRSEIRNNSVRAVLELLCTRLVEHRGALIDKRAALIKERGAKDTEHNGGFDAYSPE